MKLALLSVFLALPLCASPLARLNPHPKKMAHYMAHHKKLETTMAGVGAMGLLDGKIWLNSGGKPQLNRRIK